MKPITCIGLTTAITFALMSACSVSGRPSESNLSKAIQARHNILGIGTVPASQADCLAAALSKSKLSDDTLKAIVDADSEYKNSDADAKIMLSLGEQVTKCASS